MKIEQLFEDLNKRFSYRRSSLAMTNANDIKPSFIRYFIHWLRKEHLLRVFIENYESPYTFSIYYAHEFLASAFSWEETPQHGDFWEYAHIRWLKHIKNNNKKLELLYGVTEKSKN